jgi:hypothetical protein
VAFRGRPRRFRFYKTNYEEESWTEGKTALLVLRRSSAASEAVYRAGPASENITAFLLAPKVVAPLRSTRLEFWRMIFFLRRRLDTGKFSDGSAVEEDARVFMEKALSYHASMRPPPTGNTRKLEIIVGPQVRAFLTFRDAMGLACGCRS